MPDKQEAAPDYRGAAGAYRKKVINWSVKHTCPETGNDFWIRKPPMQQWMLSNQLPQDLNNRAADINTSLEEDVNAVRAALEQDEIDQNRKELIDFTLRLMEDGLVCPRFKRKLAEGDNPEDFLTLNEILDEDWTFVMGIVGGTSDKENIPMEGGSLTRGELATFPDGSRNGEYDQFGRRGPALRGAPVIPSGYEEFDPRN